MMPPPTDKLRGPEGRKPEESAPKNVDQQALGVHTGVTLSGRVFEPKRLYLETQWKRNQIMLGSAPLMLKL